MVRDDQGPGLWRQRPRRPDPPDHGHAGGSRRSRTPCTDRLREAAPVHRSGLDGVWYVSGFDACRQILGDTRIGKNDQFIVPRHGVDPERVRLAQRRRRTSMLTANPPEHTRLRGAAKGAFIPPTMEALRPRVAAIVAERLDRLAALGEADVMAELAFPMPVTVVGEMVGVPEEDRAWFRPLMRTLVSSDSLQALAGGARRGGAGRRRARRLLRGADRPAAQGAGRRPALLLHRPGRRAALLDEDELFSTVTLLFFAGFLTTTNLIGNGLVALFDHPDEHGPPLGPARSGRLGRRGDPPLRLAGPVRPPQRARGLRARRAAARRRRHRDGPPGRRQPGPGPLRRPRPLRRRAGPRTSIWPSPGGSTSASAPGSPGWRVSSCSPGLVERFARIEPAGEPVRNPGLGHPGLRLAAGPLHAPLNQARRSPAFRGPAVTLPAPHGDHCRSAGGQQGSPQGRRPRQRVRVGHRRRLQEAGPRGPDPRFPARKGAPSAPRSPSGHGDRPGAGASGTPCPTTTCRRSSRKTSTRSPRRSSRSPAGRKTATSSSTPSSRSGPRSRSRATTPSRSRSRTRRSPTRRSTPRSTQLRERFADLEDSTTPLAKGDYAQLNIKGYIHDEEVPGLTRQRLPLRGRLRAGRAQARRPSSQGKQPGRHAQVQRRAPRPLGRTGRRRGRLPGAGEGDQAQGPPRGHRRVGRRGQRVRDARGPRGRHPQPDGERPADPGPPGRPGQGAPGRRGQGGHRPPRAPRSRRRWSAGSTTSSTGSRSRGPPSSST